MDWLRAVPGRDGCCRLKDPEYSVIFALCYGLPMTVVGPLTTCVNSCDRAKTLSGPALTERGWLFGHHFLHCPAGKRRDNKTNPLSRHNAVAKVLGDMLAAVFGATVDTSMGATQFSTEDGRRLDLSCHLLHDNGVSTGADVTVISAFEHEMRARDTAATQI